MPAGGHRSPRLTDLWYWIATDASRLGFLLIGDLEQAHKIARAVFVRCCARWQDRRDPYSFEAWLRRSIVRAALRRDRLRGMVMIVTRRPAPPPQNLAALSASNQKLWRALLSLRFRHRAALVLRYYTELSAGQTADALGASPGGVEALSARAFEGVRGRLDYSDGPDPSAEVPDLLRAVAQRVDLPDDDRGTVVRRARTARVGGTLAVAAGIAVLGASALAVAGAMRSESLGAPTQPERRPGVDERLRVANFQGYPGWCPTIGGALPHRPEDTVTAAQLAARMNIALVKGFADRLPHLVERPVGSLPLSQWPSTMGALGLRVVGAGGAGSNRVLAKECGPVVAARTLTVVIEESSFPEREGVAFFLIRKASGLKVWGSFAGDAE